jgi:hypothetical protein
MTSADAGRSNARTPLDDFLAHAKFRAAENPSGIGATVTRSEFKDGKRVWECIVTDGHEWHYVEVIGSDLGPFAPVEPEELEDAIERFAAAVVPPEYRLRALVNANPLHVNRQGEVTD